MELFEFSPAPIEIPWLRAEGWPLVDPDAMTQAELVAAVIELQRDRATLWCLVRESLSALSRASRVAPRTRR